MTVTDNFDDAQVLQSKLVVTGSVNTLKPAGTAFLISYNVNDSSSNSARTVSRTVTIVDTFDSLLFSCHCLNWSINVRTPPVITVLGQLTLTVEAATSYSDAGYGVHMHQGTKG